LMALQFYSLFLWFIIFWAIKLSRYVNKHGKTKKNTDTN
jgi:hypothetical protein